MNMLSKLLGYDVDEATEENLEKVHAPKHGPVRMRHVTNGQVRRAQDRRIKTQRRKATLRFRRDWMKNRLAIATLRGQLNTVDLRSPKDPHHVVAVATLIARYGSVADAREHYEAILAEAAGQ